ncbi:MAG: HEPN domain-containing protein [Alphaproteobacteria bacterium]
MLPETDEEFDALMKIVDAELSSEQVPIEKRAIISIMRISEKYGISIPIFDPISNPALLKHPASNFGERINNWFTKVYGDRSKTEFSPGDVVVQLSGDLYRVSIPLIYGRFQVNPIRFVRDLTVAKAQSLHDEDLDRVDEVFDDGIHALTALDQNSHIPLIRQARGDLQAAVEHLMSQRREYGSSKWASLQATEKVLKAALTLEGSEFRLNHDLAQLFEALNRSGVTIVYAEFVDAIQCRASIRYGEESCSRDEAYRAHRACLRVIVELLAAGSKLERGIPAG